MILGYRLASCNIVRVDSNDVFVEISSALIPFGIMSLNRFGAQLAQQAL